jgi:hypothetical protein
MAVTGRGIISNVTVSAPMARVHLPSCARQLIADAPAKTGLTAGAVISKKSVQEKKIALMPIGRPIVISLTPLVGVNIGVKNYDLLIIFVEFESIETCPTNLQGYRYIEDSQESTKF